MPPSVKLTAFALGNFTNHAKDVAWPSEETLAGMTGLGIRTVRRSIAWLKDRKCLYVVCKHRSMSKWPTNHYQWLSGLERLPKVPEATVAATQDTGGHCDLDRRPPCPLPEATMAYDSSNDSSRDLSSKYLLESKEGKALF